MLDPSVCVISSIASLIHLEEEKIFFSFTLSFFPVPCAVPPMHHDVVYSIIYAFLGIIFYSFQPINLRGFLYFSSLLSSAHGSSLLSFSAPSRSSSNRASSHFYSETPNTLRSHSYLIHVLVLFDVLMF